MKNVLQKLRSGLDKTRKNLVDGVVKAVGDGKKVDAALLDELEELLISADVGIHATDRIIEALVEKSADNAVNSADYITNIVKKEITALLEDESRKKEQKTLQLNGAKPHVILMVGVNGTGKTTTIGKLAYAYKRQGKKVLLAAADTFRAAAAEQLDIWAQRVGADMIKNQHGADPASVAFDSLRAAIARQVDVLIVDTAGRLHTKVNLMDELKKIRRVLDKCLPGAPHEVLLVIDATTGQNAINQTRQFLEAVDISGIVLAKLDGTAKGGIVVAIRQELGIHVKYIGLGEQLEDLQPFDPAIFAEALFR